MALHTELPICRDTYKSVLDIFFTTKNFPKAHKYSLGRNMERNVLLLMRFIYRANRAQEKTTFLDNLEILKLEIRVCLDLKQVVFTVFRENLLHLSIFPYFNFCYPYKPLIRPFFNSPQHIILDYLYEGCIFNVKYFLIQKHNLHYEQKKILPLKKGLQALYYKKAGNTYRGKYIQDFMESLDALLYYAYKHRFN